MPQSFVQMSTTIQSTVRKPNAPKVRFKEFKESWAKVRFTDCCDLIHGFQFRDEHFSETGLPVIKIGNLIDDGGISFKNITYVPENLKDQFSKFVLNKGDVLMALTGGTLGKVSKVDKDYGIIFQNYRVGKFVAKENSTNDYVYIILQSDPVQSRIKSLVNEAAQPNFGKQDFDKIHVGLPSLPEQQKIASFLSAIDEKIQQLTRKKELLEQYKKGVMQQLFSGKLRFKDENGKAHPKWVEKRLGDITTIVKGKGISKSDIDENGTLECIRYGELYTHYKERITKIYSRTNVDKGELVLSGYNDVIIPSSGETQLDIARAACVLKSGVALGGDLNILISQQNGVFLSYYINHSLKYEIAKVAQGNSVVHLYPSQLEPLKVQLPSVGEQKKIAHFIGSLDDRIEGVEAQIAKTQTFKQGLLQQMFV